MIQLSSQHGTGAHTERPRPFRHVHIREFLATKISTFQIDDGNAKDHLKCVHIAIKAFSIQFLNDE